MKNILVSIDISIRDAMKKLEKTAEKCLVVVDENSNLLGTLTDGDIRRAILSGTSMSNPIKDHYNCEPTVIDTTFDKKDAIRQLLLEKKIDLIPVINEQRKVVDYKIWSDIVDSVEHKKVAKLNVPVVIMAGGMGTRMQPFTQILPKPLLPINGQPIIDHIINKFLTYGISSFFISINYKKRLLKAYFEDEELDYTVEFMEEDEPLGTAGCLSMLRGKMKTPFFVSNCDIIIDADYSVMYKFHKTNQYDLTLVAAAKDYVIPYGTCVLNSEGHLSSINEKPKYEFLVNTGLYIINPDLLDLIPANKFFHITHLIEEAISRGMRIGVFPVADDAWKDVGEWSEYRKTVKSIEN